MDVIDRSALPGVDADGFVDLELVRTIARRGVAEVGVSYGDLPALLVEGDARRAKSTYKAAVDRERSYARTTTSGAEAKKPAIHIQGDVGDAGDHADLARYLGRVAFLSKRPGGLFPDMVTVGRALNNDVPLVVASVSKVHGYFRREGAGWTFTDQKSTNGTLHQQRRLSPGEKVVLRDGDHLQFGDHLSCVFLLPASLAQRVLDPTKR